MNGAEPLLRDAPLAACVGKPFDLDAMLATLEQGVDEPPRETP